MRHRSWVPFCVGWALVATAMSLKATAQSAVPIPLQKFALEIREGYACDLSVSNAIVNMNFTGEKLCRVMAQNSIAAETGKILNYQVIHGPEVFAIMNRGYVVPHARSLYLMLPGLSVRSRRIAMCLSKTDTVKEAYEVHLHAVMISENGDASSACGHPYIGSIVASPTTPVAWTNLATSSEKSDGSSASQYLIQYRVVLAE